MPDITLITKDFVDRIVSHLASGGAISEVDEAALQWLRENQDVLVGMSVETVQGFLKSLPSNSPEDLGAAYDKIVAGMTWEEKLAFMRAGVEDLKTSAVEKFRLPTLLKSLANVVIGVIPKIPALLGLLV